MTTPLALVMLVDDEIPFVETMTKRLEKRELNVISAFSGRVALETLDKHQNIDVVILDVKMPGCALCLRAGDEQSRYFARCRCNPKQQSVAGQCS